MVENVDQSNMVFGPHVSCLAAIGCIASICERHTVFPLFLHRSDELEVACQHADAHDVLHHIATWCEGSSMSPSKEKKVPGPAPSLSYASLISFEPGCRGFLANQS